MLRKLGSLRLNMLLSDCNNLLSLIITDCVISDRLNHGQVNDMNKLVAFEESRYFVPEPEYK